MAAPLSPSRLGRTSKDEVDDAGATRPGASRPGAISPSAMAEPPNHDDLIRELRTMTDYSLQLATNLSNQYCEKVLMCKNVDLSEFVAAVEIGPFQMTRVPANPHFDDDMVDDALRDVHRNFQAYMISLKKIHEHHTPEEDSVSGMILSVRAKIKEILESLERLIKVRGKQPPAIVKESEVADIPFRTSDFSTTRVLRYGILMETMNGVDYLRQLLLHLSPRQSTKL